MRQVLPHPVKDDTRKNRKKARVRADKAFLGMTSMWFFAVSKQKTLCLYPGRSLSREQRRKKKKEKKRAEAFLGMICC